MIPDIHITAVTIRWFLLGNLLGVAVGGIHYYLLRATINWSVSMEPGVGKVVVTLASFLRFAGLALALYWILQLAGFSLALGLISGISLSQVIWIILLVKDSYREKFQG